MNERDELQKELREKEDIIISMERQLDAIAQAAGLDVDLLSNSDDYPDNLVAQVIRILQPPGGGN